MALADMIDKALKGKKGGSSEAVIVDEKPKSVPKEKSDGMDAGLVSAMEDFESATTPEEKASAMKSFVRQCKYGEE